MYGLHRGQVGGALQERGYAGVYTGIISVMLCFETAGERQAVTNRARAKVEASSGNGPWRSNCKEFVRNGRIVGRGEAGSLSIHS